MKALFVWTLSLALIQFAAAQVTLAPSWSDRYNGTANGYDYAGGLCTEASGNFYVAGSSPPNNSLLSFVVVKYSAAGIRQWTARHTGAGGQAFVVAVDSSSNVYAAGYRWGGSNIQEVLVKFGPNGQEQWFTLLDGRATKLMIDANGNVIVIGSYGDGYDSDWSIQKFTPQGIKLWEFRYDDPFGRNDVIANARFDSMGHLIVAGTAGIDSGSAPGDVVIAKIRADGRAIWVRSFTVGATTHEFADDMGLDHANNIYVNGGAANSGNIYEQATDLWLKFNSNGQLVGQSFGGPVPNGDVGSGAVDASGNMYSVTFSRLAKFSPTGTMLWSREILSPPLGVSIPKLVLTAAGEVVIAGTTYEGNANYDYLILGFSPGGAPLWQYRYAGPVGGSDTVADLTANPKGDVFVTGTSWNQYSSIGGTADDIVTLKFNRSQGSSR